MTAVELSELGWRPFFSAQLTQHDAGLLPARIARQDVNRYHLLTADGAAFGILRGRARIDAGSSADLPAVGDWVLCSPAEEGDNGSLIIERTLQRFSKFSRKVAGDRVNEQIVAANIDTVFIVSGLDENFNPARIERYLWLTQSSGARPVIVLNKVDLDADPAHTMKALNEVAAGVTVCRVSGLTGEGLESLLGYLHSGETVALLGSSGVGKSTIINRLLGYDRFRTGEVRTGDSKGRHTTTFRELCKLPGGGMLIDTPGMREVQLWTDDVEQEAGFEDIEVLADSCRFNDCAHESEPGCAVKAAIAAGQLTQTRLHRWRRIKEELEALEGQKKTAARTAGSRHGKRRKKTEED